MNIIAPTFKYAFLEIFTKLYEQWKTNGMSVESNSDLSLLPAEIETGLYYWTD